MRFSRFPKVTVIVVCYNSELRVAATIESILAQTYQNIEIVIVDGGSTDSTPSIIRSYQEFIDVFVSEPDEGIADAMNKGAQKATGDFLFYLNSDDCFASKESLKSLVSEIDERDDIICGSVYLGTPVDYKVLVSRGFNCWMNIKTGVLHQSSLIRKSAFDLLGGFDTSFKIALDYEFFLRAYRKNFQCKVVRQIVAFMSGDGVSSQTSWNIMGARLLEERRAHLKNSKTKSMDIFYSLWWLLYMPYKKFSAAIKETKVEY